MIAGLQQADKNLLKKANLGTLFSLIIGYRQHLRVVGNSMEGILSDGDLIIYKKINPKNIDLKTGNIVVAFHPEIKNKLTYYGIVRLLLYLSITLVLNY